MEQLMDGIKEDCIMKKLIYISLAAIVLAACAKETSEPEYIPEYYTFNAVFDEATKVAFGTLDGGSIPLEWKNGDEVAFRMEKSDDSKVTRKGTITVDGSTVSLTLDLASAKNGWESVIDIWYPYTNNLETERPASIKTAQSYDRIAVPVHMTAMTASTVTFATYLDYVVLEFPVTQTSHLISEQHGRATYLPKSTRLSEISLQTSGGVTYTLDTSSDPAVDLKTLYESVDANNRVTVNHSYYMVIAPIASEDITVTYKTEDDVTYSNSKSALTIAGKSYRRMPVMDLTGYHFWRFGTDYTNTDCNGVVYWLRDLLGNGTQMSLGKYSDVTYMENNGENYMTIYPYKSGDSYIYDVGPMWNTGRFSSDGSTQLVFNDGGISNKSYMTFSQKYPVLAIAMDAPKNLAKVTTGSGYHKFEPGDINNRAFVNETGKPVTLIYAKLYENIVKDVAIYDQNRAKMYLRVGFTEEPAAPGPGLKIYWAGTFRSDEEATAYYNSYFGY